MLKGSVLMRIVNDNIFLHNKIGAFNERMFNMIIYRRTETGGI